MMRRSRNHRLEFECLESRRVLAGNVQALVSQDVMVVIGDAADNQIEISQASNGGFVVTGLNTTVNGSSDPVVINGGFRHMTVVMHDGNDEVFVNSVDVRSNFTFRGGFGNDRLQTRGLRAYHFHAEGQGGDDVFDLTQAIDQSSYLYLGVGDDVVSVENVRSGRNLKIFGQGGNDTLVASNLNVGRKLEIAMLEGNDNVLFEGAVSVGLHTNINTDDGNDFVGVLPAQNNGAGSFGNRLSVFLGSGADSLALDGGVNQRGLFRADGGPGADSLQRGNASLRADRASGFESNAVSNLDALIATVMDRLVEAGIGEELVIPLEAAPSTSTLNVLENSNPLQIDSGFRLQASELVTGAVVQIGDFAAGQDVLTFTNTGFVSGSFNPATGTLTLTGNTSAQNYQAALRSVRYQNTSDRPLTDLRQFNIRVTTAEESVSVFRNFQVIAVNDTPLVVPSNDTITVLPEDLPVVIDSLLTVTDADNDNLVSATVSIVSGFQTGDLLTSQDANGITSQYDATTGILSLTGSASVINWQSLLRSVAFESTATDVVAGTRNIRFLVNDGQDTGSAEILVNLQEDSLPVNTFVVSEDAANGTVIGRVVLDGDFDMPMIFQFGDDQVPAEVLLNADDHISGDATSPVVLIEYLSYQCPACAVNHPIITQLEANFEGQLIVVRRHQPLEQFFPNARAAAIAAEAAGRQGMFEAMTDLLFVNQAEWSPQTDPTEFFEKYAAELDLDLDRFRLDVADPALDARVTRDRDDASGLGINSTPSFILQNAPLANPGNLEAFDQAIQDAIDALDNPFVIDRETGDIIVRDRSLIDASTNPTITFPVLVKDVNGNEELVTITINVLTGSMMGGT